MQVAAGAALRLSVITAIFRTVADSSFRAVETPGFEAGVSSGWPALTAALKMQGSPLKRWLQDRFPASNAKLVFQRYRESVGPLLVPASAALTGGAGTIGGAFDHLVRFLIQAEPDLRLPAIGAARCGGRMPRALSELAVVLGPTDPSYDRQHDSWQTPSSVCPDLVARGCWALCLLTELSRGVPPESSPLAELDARTVTGQDLLCLASIPALEQLAALRTQAEHTLLPFLPGQPGTWAVGPTFEGSTLMNADADLILDGTLVEIKTTLGTRRADGTYYAALNSQTLFQLLGYVLLDFGDAFSINELALFNARYGHLATWELHVLLDKLAGHRVDLAALRAEFQQFLREGAKLMVP